jgi:hypothetical protein
MAQAVEAACKARDEARNERDLLRIEVERLAHLNATIERVKALCEDADDQRRWLTAFEIRAALEPSS